ncbi:MAG: Ig-like domain-containing protein, partial [Polaromonas sp.]|nr:Ig-like domain-containing protein [Polaromonas sp.]
MGALAAGCGGGSDGRGVTLASASPLASTTPADVVTNVQTNGKILTRFSKPMDPASLNKNTFTVTAPGAAPVDGAVTFDAASNTAIFTPAKPLAADTLFTATVTTGARDTAGLALASSFVWTFTTGKAADIKPPVITQADPLDSARDVATNRKITAVFDEAIDPASISATNFTLTGPGAAPVTGLVSLVGTTAIFTPVNSLNASTPYTATIRAAVKDLAGHALASDLAWRFTTANAAQALAKGPSLLNLSTAGSYAILAKAGVSATGTTHINGDIGLSPAAETFITGFFQARDPSNQWSTALLVTGKLYAANMAVPTPAKLTTAVGDMETAYTDAAGRSLPDTTELGVGNFSGMTLEPGLHKW